LKLEEAETFSRFVQDVLVEGSVRLVGLQPDDVTSIVDAAGKYGLDFDDAYQYAASAKFNFRIVSFDSDFDRTDRGKAVPGQVETDESSEMPRE